jgi:hypothetical protein
MWKNMVRQVASARLVGRFLLLPIRLVALLVISLFWMVYLLVVPLFACVLCIFYRRGLPDAAREARVLMYALFVVELGTFIALCTAFGSRGLLVILGLAYLVAVMLCSRDTRLAGLLAPKPENRVV